MNRTHRGFGARPRATLRLALRQVRRTPGSTALVVSLIVLPVFVLSASVVFFQSHQPTNAQRVTVTLGETDAAVMPYGPPSPDVHQSLTTLWSWESSGTATEPSAGAPPTDIPSMVPESATIIPVSLFNQVTIRTADAQVPAQVTAGAVWLPSFTGRYHLDEGRAPTNAGEALATPSFLDRIDARQDDTLTTTNTAVPKLTITGVISSQELDASTDLVVGFDSPIVESPDRAVWFIDGWQPDIEEFIQLNAQGYAVLGRDLMLNPPPSYQGPMDQVAGTAIPILVLITAAGAFCAVVVVLICGAAMSVSARRQQQSLAVAASVGSSRGDLFAMVLGQGLVLGLIAGVLGVSLGIGVAAVLLAGDVGGSIFGRQWGLHIPWTPVLLLAGLAIVIAFAASIAPARTVTRGDILAALRGSRRPVALVRALPRWGMAVLLLGLTATAVGIVMLVATIPTGRTGSLATVTGILVVCGPIVALVGVGMSGHWLVTALARACARTGVATRLAVRDAAANPARTVPAFLAIASAVFLATAGMAVQSVSAGASARNYPWEAPLHAVRVNAYSADPADLQRMVEGAQGLLRDVGATSVATLTMTPVISTDPESGELTDPDQVIASLGLYSDQPECTCRNGFFPASGGEFFVVSAANLPAVAGVTLTGAEREAYDNGAVIVPISRAAIDPARSTRIFLLNARQLVSFNASGSSANPAIDFGEMRTAAVLEPKGLQFVDGPLISPTTATALGVPLTSIGAVGTFPDVLADSVMDRLTLDVGELADPERDPAYTFATVRQEIGSQASTGWLSLIVGAALLIVGGTAVVTLGLARFERRPDDATLTAVGSTTGVRRRLNVMQAIVIVGIGSVTGAILGILPGFGMVAAGSPYFQASDVPVPWIVGLALGLPLVMASIAWLIPPRRADLTRRTVIT